jgi:dimethylargininase
VLVAITRPVSATLPRCELTHVARRPLDVILARRQHGEYERAMAELGAAVVRLPPADDLPDATFVEDMAVVLDEVAILATPGAASRARELPDVERCLAQYRPLARLPAPATLDGGDVLRIGRTLFVGHSRRTNEAAIGALGECVRAFGYEVTPVPVHGCLHLKTACGYLGRETIVANGDWVDLSAFAATDVLAVPASEPWGANVLRIGEAVLVARGFPRTRALIDRRGFATREIDISELQKAEAGLTCLSVVFQSAGPANEVCADDT